MNKVTPFLMFSDRLDEAIEFYVETFPDSEVLELSRTGDDGPIKSAEFVVGGQRFVAFNGDGDPVKARAVVEAMMEMVKLDVAALEQAYAEA